VRDEFLVTVVFFFFVLNLITTPEMGDSEYDAWDYKKKN
jgi:hypothetical protein